ncbi:MAG: type I 3-dehydroquinate dehydratase [Candidatus Cloacimonadaceae bacterium]|nr:type I 3-dehydroquinate dehydratase [Candidatus Cloacimonadaceae bacterium]
MICVSIVDCELPKILSLAAEHRFIELRLDRLQIGLAELRLILQSAGRVLVSCPNLRIRCCEMLPLLEEAIKSGAAYLDIPYDTDPIVLHPLMASARDAGCRLILSYHNFEGTPELRELIHIADAAHQAGADIVKLACTVNKPLDNAIILSLYTRGYPIISLGMGSLGKITRIAALKLGAPFGFAAADAESLAAPGQFTYLQMQELLELLNRES